CETAPADQKQQSAKRRDSAQYSGSGERQDVETAGKQQNAGEKRPAGKHKKAGRPGVPYRGGNDQYRKRVIHLITHTGFKNCKHLRRKPAPERMRTESPESDAKKPENRSNQ